MAITSQRGFDTGSSGGGGPTNPTKALRELATAGSNARNTSVINSTSTGGVSSSNWYCPEGSTLARESTGSGHLVCRWNHNGAEFQALPRIGNSGGSGGSSGGSGGTSGGGRSTGGSSGGGGVSAEVAADIYARNPQAMVARQLHDRYGDTGGNALYAQLEPYADAANVLFLLRSGQDAEQGSKEAFVDWLGTYWDALQSPGGAIDYRTRMHNLMNPAADSPLHTYLTTGTSEDQANNFRRLLAGIMQTGYHPLIAQAVMDRVMLEQDRYIGDSAQGVVDPFYQELGARIPGLPRLLPYT